MATSIAVAASAQSRGEAVYNAKCARCHGADGLATSPVARSMKLRSFKDPVLMKWTDAQFIDFTSNAYKNNGMTDAQIKDAVAYIRKLQKQ